jgi:putative redox protein
MNLVKPEKLLTRIKEFMVQARECVSARDAKLKTERGEAMSTVQLTCDADKHGIAVKEPGHKSVAIGCTYHGSEIQDLSAGDLVATGVAGCMLFSMGVQARHDELDIKGTVIDVSFTMTDKPFPHMNNITLVFNMPRDYAPKDREKLEKAAGRCPLKASFGPDTSIVYKFNYVNELAAIK